MLRDGDAISPGYRVHHVRIHHVPGHCPGLLCLQGARRASHEESLLARITAHPFPQAITPFAGLERDRLVKVLSLCEQPRTVVQVAAGLFGEQEGYSRILAFDAAGAHVESMHQPGQLRIANLEDVSSSRDPVIEYIKQH